MSRPLKVIQAKVIYLTNQKFGNKPKDTNLPLTDHNAVKTIFRIAGTSEESSLGKRAFSWVADALLSIMLLGATAFAYFSLSARSAGNVPAWI